MYHPRLFLLRPAKMEDVKIIKHNVKQACHIEKYTYLCIEL